MIEKTRLLRREEASAYLLETWDLSRTPKTLSKMACVGGGPPFRKATRFPYYSTDDLDEWARSLLGPRVSSTSELAVLRSAAV